MKKITILIVLLLLASIPVKATENNENLSQIKQRLEQLSLAKAAQIKSKLIGLNVASGFFEADESTEEYLEELGNSINKDIEEACRFNTLDSWKVLISTQYSCQQTIDKSEYLLNEAQLLLEENNEFEDEM